jgi:hypothetical protein
MSFSRRGIATVPIRPVIKQTAYGISVSHASSRMEEILTRIAAMKESSLPRTDFRYAIKVPSDCQIDLFT